MTTTAVGYVRVSTDRQAEHGFGLEVQEKAVRDWARAKRIRLLEVAVDRGASGSADVVNRPGLARALGLVTAGKVGALVVPRMDRLARDLVLQEWVRGEIVRAGGQVRSCVDVEDLYLIEDPDNPTGQLVRQILGSVAQYERSMIRLRMRAGLEAKRNAGGYVGGRPPYGWAAHRGALVPVDLEQATLTRVRRARGRGHSWRQVVDELTTAGVMTRSGNPWTPYGIARAIATADSRLSSRTSANMQRSEKATMSGEAITQ